MVPELFLAPVSSCGFMAGKRMTSCTGKPRRSKLNCLNSEDSEWGGRDGRDFGPGRSGSQSRA